MRNWGTAVFVTVLVLVASGMGFLILVPIPPICSLAPKGSVLYIRLTSNYGVNPAVNGIDATPIETCNGVNTTVALIYQPPINASGVTTLDASGVTSYIVSIYVGNYQLNRQTENYQINVNVLNSLSTCANVEIGPSTWNYTLSPC